MKSNFTKDKVFIIVPAFNEGKYIRRFLEKLVKIEKNIIVISDGSSDNTSKIAKEFTKYVINNTSNRGKGAVMRQGAEYAFNILDAQAVIFMDGDDQHHPEDLKNFYTLLAENKYDLIFGPYLFLRKFLE